MRPPRRSYRTHAGWLDEVLFRPEVPRRVKKVLVEISNGTYIDKRKNLYSVKHEVLAARLGINVSNVKRAVWWAIDNKWLTVCVRGHQGRQQVYHRAVPWDPPRKWHTSPCPTCGGYFTVRRSVLQRSIEVEDVGVVDTMTGEIIDVAGMNRGAFSAQNRTPTRTPYIGTTSAPDPSPSAGISNTDFTLDVEELISLASRSQDWAGWQVVAAVRPYVTVAA